MMMLFSGVVAAIAFLTLAAAPLAAAAQVADPKATEAFLASFEPTFKQFVSNPEGDGLFGAVYVALSHPLIGDHTFIGKDAGSVDDHWGIGSLSKTFMATLILLFVEQGLIRLDQTVPELLPDLDTAEAYGNVTVYQLISMTSGVPDFFNDAEGLMKTAFENPEQEFTTQDIVDAAVASGVPVQAPGTEFYSSTNYVLLQDIAEKIGGKPANELYAEHIYGPLGMSASGDTVLPPRNSNAPVPFPRSEAILTKQCAVEFDEYGWNATEENVAIGTDITDTLTPLVDLAGAAGSMWSILSDMLIWAKSGTGNALLSPETIVQRMDWRRVAGRQYGMGIHAYTDFLGHETGYWGHSGEAFGYETLAGHNNDEDGSFFIATTSCGMEPTVTNVLFSLYLIALDEAKKAVSNSTTDDGEGMESPSPTPMPIDEDTSSAVLQVKSSIACLLLLVVAFI